ncbi:MAG: hypothetical protein WEC75_01585 [Dehalococcoidia bacterium]
MRTYGHDVRHARTLSLVFGDAVEILRQDIGEYAFIGFVGAFPACIAALVLRLAGGPVAVALIAPIVLLFAALTMATAAEAFRRVVENLEPDAALSFGRILPLAATVLRPWVPLTTTLGIGTGALTLYGEDVPSLVVACIALALIAVSGFYALPRSFVCAALVTQRATSREAEAGSAALVRGAPGKIARGWAIALAPSMFVAMLAIVSGMGPIAIALAALVFVGSTPVVAVMMSLLFFDALARSEPVQRRTVVAAGRGDPAGTVRRRV